MSRRFARREELGRRTCERRDRAERRARAAFVEHAAAVLMMAVRRMISVYPGVTMLGYAIERGMRRGVIV